MTQANTLDNKDWWKKSGGFRRSESEKSVGALRWLEGSGGIAGYMCCWDLGGMTGVV